MVDTISGKTRLFIIVADPVHHLRTPSVYNERFSTNGIDAVMVAARVASEALEGFVNGLKGVRNLEGLIVSVPHKRAIAPLCDELMPTARRVGSVNAIQVANGRLIGDIFDGLGFVEGLRIQGYEPFGRRVLLLGSGGAGSAIAFALAGTGVRRLAIWNRNLVRAEKLAEVIGRSSACEVVCDPSRSTAEIDLIVNATSLGMKDGDELPLPIELIRPGQMVAEAVMFPDETPLLRLARDRGARIHPGRHMLLAQLDAMGRFVGAF